MKKIAILLIIVLSLTGCGRYESETVSISDLGAAVTFTAGLREYRSESLKNMDIAASYGIAPGEIDEGMVYYSAKDGCIDKIILVKSLDHDGLRNVEHALETHISMLALAYRYHDNERAKIDNHLFKTRGLYTILALTDNSKKVEEVFDNMVT